MPNDAETIETPRDFERILRDAGFSRSRAKAITAKGFRSSRSPGETVETIAAEIGGKRQVIVEIVGSSLERKGFEKLVLTAHVGGFKVPWKRFPSFTAAGPSQFKLSYPAHAPRSGPFTLEVRYKSRSGFKTVRRPSHGIANTPFLIPAGIQEVQVRARSDAGFSQHILLSLFW